MTEKKTKAKPKKAVEPDVSAGTETAKTEYVVVEVPECGPDYHVTDAGEILLDTGEPIPEDHPVHPVHRALAAARKATQ